MVGEISFVCDKADIANPWPLLITLTIKPWICVDYQQGSLYLC